MIDEGEEIFKCEDRQLKSKELLALQSEVKQEIKKPIPWTDDDEREFNPEHDRFSDFQNGYKLENVYSESIFPDRQITTQPVDDDIIS